MKDEIFGLGPNEEIAVGTDGIMRVINTATHTCRKLCKSKPIEDIKFAELDCSDMDLTPYQRYLKDRFGDEDCPIKNKKLIFRGYRVSCTADAGFLVEDTLNRYEPVQGNWEGIPTPEELGDFIEEHTTRKAAEPKAEDLKKAVERGKQIAEQRKADAAARRDAILGIEKCELTLKDYEKLRKEVLAKIESLRGVKDNNFEELIIAIPFKRWRRKAKALLKQLTEKKIRRGAFLNELQKVTEEETFVVEEKRHRSTFKGILSREYKKVGYLRGDKIEVDDKLVDAVPFLTEVLLHEEPRVMSQYMKYAKGLITDREFIDKPIDVDWKVDYKKNSMANTAHNAQVLSIVFDRVGLIAPQDLLYETDLKVGDVILLLVDGELKRRTVAKVEGGVEIGREVGLLKTDKFIMAPPKPVKEPKEKSDKE